MDTPTTWTKNRGAKVDNLEYKESKHDDLVDHSYGGNATIWVAAQHNSIYSTQHHDEQGLYKDGGSEFGKSLF